MVINLHQRHWNSHGCWTHSTSFCYQLPSKTETHIFFSVFFLKLFPNNNFHFIHIHHFCKAHSSVQRQRLFENFNFSFLADLAATRRGKARHARPPLCVNTTLFFRSAFKPEWSMSGYVVRVWLHWHSFTTHESRWIYGSRWMQVAEHICWGY